MFLLRRVSSGRASFALPFLLFASTTFAQDATVSTDGTLHILRPIIHTEQDRAELCLETDHTLDDSDRARSSISIKLESDGKKIAVPQQGLNITAAMLCLPSLDHHRNYRLTLTNLKGSNGEKLNEPYQFSFTVPDRKASLAFLSDLYAGGMMRWQNNDPVLRGINVNHAKIELYRITTLPLMLEAWRQHKQTTLAPTESATFARDKGQLVWQGNLDLDTNPNNVVEQKVPLHDTVHDLAPGFYLVVASAILPKSEATKSDLVPLAAAWLLRSNLKVHALHDTDGMYAVTEKADASGVFQDVRVLLDDANQQTLVEGKSDADGLAHLPLPADKLGSAATLIGMADSGDVDFDDLTQTLKMQFVLPDMTASLQSDKNFYAPGATANVVLTAQNAQGQPQSLTGNALSDSRLQILRPDRSLFTIIPVPNDKTGIAHLAVPVPVGNGSWILQWQQNNGTNMAEIPLRITANDEAPHLDINADRIMIEGNDGLTLNLSGTTASGKAAPFIDGQVAVTWVTPDSLFPGWNGYHFGGIEIGKSNTAQVASFLTDAKGQAQLHIDLTPPADGTALRAAQITVQSDPASGAADPAPLIIPVKPADMIVGVKPLATDGRFAENSLARFDIVALSNDGKRRDAEGLSYQIIEQGRSFDWYQDSGRWNYKPLEQTRRIGGGVLNLKADSSNRIDWPVNAGSYQLIIRDAADKILAQTSFSAGWGSAQNDAAKTAPLTLTPSAPELHANEEAKIHFKLDQPAMVTATLADDHIRKVLHLAQSAGDDSVAFTPDASWHSRLTVSLSACTVGADGLPLHLAGQITLPLLHATADSAAKPGTSAAAAEALPALSLTGAELPVLHSDDHIQFTVTLKNNTAAATTYHYAFTVLPGLKILGSGSGSLTLAPGQSRDVTVTLNALQAGAKDLKLDITGAHNFHLSNNWTFTVAADDLSFNLLPQQEIAARQSWSWPASAKPADKTKTASAHASESGFVFVAPYPLFDLPQILAARIQEHGFTTSEIAGEMDLLRLWHDTLLQTGLLSEQKILTKQHNLLLQLLARQKPDGSFPHVPDSDGDIASTAAAVTALSADDQPLAKLAVGQASDWLRRRLDNSWFDEQERPERAAAYAALAAAGRSDSANLHYFSDTSADKSLPPLAAAQLALAFAKTKDQDKAIFWLNAVKGAKQGPDIMPQLLPLLAENTFFDEHNVLSALEHVSGTKPAAVTATTDFLRAMWFMQNRAGTWRVTINGADQTLKNILMTTLPAPTATFAVHNPIDRSLFLTEAYAVKASVPNDAAITRRIYRLDGSEITENDSLNRNETYLVVAEGPWPASTKNDGDDSDDGLLVHNPLGPALNPISCVLNKDTQTNDSMGWIKNMALMPATACEKSGAALDALLSRSDRAAKRWRIASLATAERSGMFSLNPVQIRFVTDDQGSSLRQGARIKLRIN